jgi:AcrR family transcriptional regulator
MLNQDEVLKVALEVVNAEGLSALTMRRLAKELGVGNTTVHSAFGGKEALLQALANHVLADLPDVDDLHADKPEEALVDFMLAVHRLLISQPAIAQLTVIRRMHNRSFFRAQETVLELLREYGLDDGEAYDAYDALTNYFFGFTLNRISRQDFDRNAMIASLPRDEFPAVHAIGPLFTRRTPEEQLAEGIRRFLHVYRP